MINFFDLQKSTNLDGNGNDHLPRLLYFSDVPVEAYMHGSLLIYRLLEKYPKDKILIVERRTLSKPERRIPGVRYVTYKDSVSRFSRLLRTRIGSYASPLVAFWACFSIGGLDKIAREFEPEAVLTLVWGYEWMTTAAYAERCGIALHLIVHDDLFSPYPKVSAIEHRWMNQCLRHWYPKAASRLPVSPYMVEEYRHRYNAGGDVLYPSRAAGATAFQEPPKRLERPCEPFTVVFGGSVHRQYLAALKRMALALRKFGGRLLIFGTANADSVAHLNDPNIEWRGQVNSEELVRSYRDEAHSLFVPMSYIPEDRCNMELSFPSKLADYTASGLPLIIDGPEYCSAVRWSRENRGVAEVITDETVASLEEAIGRLMNPTHRLRLAVEAISMGNKYFSWDRAINLLYAKLRNLNKAQDAPPQT